MNAASRHMLSLSFCLVLLLAGPSLSAAPFDSGKASFMAETSAWMLYDLTPDSADFYQLILGFRLDEKNSIFLNAITWKYRAPLGIPFGPRFDSPEEEYPGHVRAFGLGLGYQRFLWKGLFASLYATPFLQDYHQAGSQKVESGFQLFLQAQLGYQVELFRGRMYLKPALSCNYWPVNTNLPSAFRDREKAWPNYFLLEPHLNIGIRF